jgi:hypothetical protein
MLMYYLGLPEHLSYNSIVQRTYRRRVMYLLTHNTLHHRTCVVGFLIVCDQNFERSLKGFFKHSKEHDKRSKRLNVIKESILKYFLW